MAPDSARVAAWLGQAYRRMGQYDRALALLKPLAGQKGFVEW